jgi:uncharacterized protein (DUF2132 family)
MMDDRNNEKNLAQSHPRPNNLFHGITLKMVLTRLVNELGWEEMGYRVKIRCFTDDPSISSSLKFLRRTPWAREKVETLYLRAVR